MAFQTYQQSLDAANGAATAAAPAHRKGVIPQSLVARADAANQRSTQAAAQGLSTTTPAQFNAIGQAANFVAMAAPAVNPGAVTTDPSDRSLPTAAELTLAATTASAALARAQAARPE